MGDVSKSVLPDITLQISNFSKFFRTGFRGRKTRKTLADVKLTAICGLMTFFMLRSCITGGKLRTPMDDFQDIERGRKLLYQTIIETKENIMVDSENDTVIGRSETMDLATQELPVVKEDIEVKLIGSSEKLDPESNSTTEDREEEDSALDKSTGHLSVSSGLKRKPQILLVTGSQPTSCQNAEGDHYLLKSVKNKIDYCRLHGIEMFYNMAHLDPELPGFWAKLPIIRELMLSQPKAEWIWWMDSDALFTDMSFELPMEKYEDYNIVLHGWDELVYTRKQWTGLNTGSFLIRNCQWSLDLLEAWSPMGRKGTIREEAGKLLTRELTERPEFEADDQSALVYLLSTETPKWSDKVFLENSYSLHGYWEVLVEEYEKMTEKYHPGMGDERWPLVTHFVGCKPCSGALTDAASRRCMHHMQRAFNFADNQILKLHGGFRHPTLESADVERFPKPNE